MEEQMQSKVLEIVTQVQTTVARTGDFAVDQLSDVAKQYVIYGIVSGWVSVLLTLSVLAMFIYLTRRMFRWESKDGKELEGFFAIPVMLALPVVWHLLNTLKNALLVTFAPKVWLLQELADMLNRIK